MDTCQLFIYRFEQNKFLTGNIIQVHRTWSANLKEFSDRETLDQPLFHQMLEVCEMSMEIILDSEPKKINYITY